MASDKTYPFLDGWRANRRGVNVEDNPYSETTQNFSHNEWCSGWCERFSAVKHGLDLGLDEECHG